eukprot:scaffold232332_cov32-Prasinocladus_malaysianus.AAC.1
MAHQVLVGTTAVACDAMLAPPTTIVLLNSLPNLPSHRVSEMFVRGTGLACIPTKRCLPSLTAGPA